MPTFIARSITSTNCAAGCAARQARASRLKIAIQHSLAISLFPRLVEDLRRKGHQPAYHLHCANRSDCIETMLRDEAGLLICYEAERASAVVAPGSAVRLAVGP